MVTNPRVRKALTWVAGLGFVGALMVVPAMAQEDAAATGLCSFTDAAGVVTTWPCETEDGTTPTTTTLVPPTTTTEDPTTTTTEVPPTTTTVVPPTTTTTPPPGEHPTPPAGRHFDILLGGDAGGGNQNLWDALYYRELSTGCGWIEGDRDGYRFAYMFLACGNHPTVPAYFAAAEAALEAFQEFGRNSPEYQAAAGAENNAARAIPVSSLVARVSFSGGYGDITTAVQDEAMNEGERYYDGTLGAPGTVELNDAPRLSPVGSCPDPDDRPIHNHIVNLDTNRIVEPRDYIGVLLNEGPNVTISVVSVTSTPFTDDTAQISAPDQVFSRSIIGSCLEGERAVIVYYDTLVANYEMQVS